MDFDDLFAEYRRRPGAETLLGLLRAAQEPVFRLCDRVLRQRQDAEDAAQQVLLGLIDAAPRAANAEQLRSWIRKASLHTALAVKRRRRRSMERERFAAALSDPETDDDLRDEVHQALEQLQPELRDVIVEHYFESRTLEEMAGRRRLSTVAVWKRIEKARDRLRLALGGASALCLAQVLEASEAVGRVPDLLTPAVAAKARAAAAIPAAPNAGILSTVVGALAVAGLLAVTLLRTSDLPPAPAAPAPMPPAAFAELPAVGPETADGDRPAGDLTLPPGATARLGTRRFRHDLHVSSVAFSPDGRRLASCGGRELCVWDLATGRELKRVVADARSVQCAAWSPDGSLLATGGNDHIVRLWSADGEPRLLRGHEHHVFRLAFSADGKTLASASSDGTLRLWDVGSGLELRALRGHADVVYALALRGDGRRLASRSQDGTVRMWDAATGEEIRRFPADDPSPHPLPVAFSPDGKILAFWSRKQIRFVDAESGEASLAPLDAASGPVELAFAPDGRYLAWVAAGRVTLWDPAAQREIRSVAAPAVHSMAVSPDGRTLALGGDRSVALWDTSTDALPSESGGHADQILALAPSRDGRRLATVGADGKLVLWDLPRKASEREGTVRLQPRGIVRTPLAAFSPDGATLVLAEAGGARVLGMPGGETIETLALAGVCPLEGGLSEDGTRLLGLAGAPDVGLRAVVLLELPSRRELARWRIEQSVAPGGFKQYDHVRGAAFDPAGRTVAVAFEPPHGEAGGQPVPRAGYVRILDVASGRERRRIEGHETWIQAVAFSPDGRRLATGGGDRTLRIWDLESGKALHVLRGHRMGICALAWSPDGRTVATAGYDSALILRDAATGTALLTSRDLRAVALAFSPDGRTLFSGMSDGTILLWPTPNS